MRSPTRKSYVVAVLAAPLGYENRSKDTSSLHVSVVVVKGGPGWKTRAADTRMYGLPSATRPDQHVRASVAGYVTLTGEKRQSYAYSLMEEVTISLPDEDNEHFNRFRAGRDEVMKTFAKAIQRMRKRAKRKGRNLKIGNFNNRIRKVRW